MSIVNYENVKWVNVNLVDEPCSYMHKQRFLHSAASQLGVKVNIIGLKDEELQKDFVSYLSFDQKVDGLNIFHSPRVILADTNTYNMMVQNPHVGFLCSRFEEFNQSFWPYVPKTALFVKTLEASDQMVKSEHFNGEVVFYPQCMYQL